MLPSLLAGLLSTQRKTDRHEYCNTPAITSYCGLSKKKALCTPSLTAYMQPGAGERLEPGVDPTWRLWTDSKQIGNCRPNHQHVPTRNLGTEPRAWFLVKWGTVVRTASNSQRGTSDFRQMGNWLESQLGRERDTESRAENWEELSHGLQVTAKKTVNSEGDSWVRCLGFFLSLNVRFTLDPVAATKSLEEQNSPE